MNPDFIDICQQLETWYQRPSGQYLSALEDELGERLLDQVFGQHVLQLGVTRNQPLGRGSAFPQHTYLGASPSADIGLIANGDHLPFATDSIDAVIIHHALDFSSNPHQLLREAQRVLMPQGRLIILGFNPWSLLGLSCRVRAIGPGQLWPSCNRLSVHRLKDWLGLLGCEVESIRYSYSVPPRGSRWSSKQLRRMDGFANRHNALIGGVYGIRAQKRVSTLTPSRRRVERSRRAPLIGLAVPQAVARRGDGDSTA